MTIRRSPSVLRRILLQLLFAAIAGASFPLIWAVPAEAQGSLDEAEVGYEAALAEYSGLLGERERTFSGYEQALDRVDAARGAGDEERRTSAYADFQVVALDLMDLELAVEQSGTRVAEARAMYLDALEAREQELLVRLDGDQSLAPQVETALLEEWRLVRTRTLEVQAESMPEEAIALRPVPELMADPRDGPVESIEKARFMEEQALSYDSLIVDLDARVEELERQMQQRQSVQDLLRDVGRFGFDFVRGGPPGLASAPDAGPDGDQGGPADGLPDPDAALAQFPLAEQIALLRGTRDLAIQYRDQALMAARLFRDRAEGMRP